MTTLQTLLQDAPFWAGPHALLTLVVAFAAASVGVLLLHGVVFGVLHRIRRRTPDRLPLHGHLVTRSEQPSRWVLVAVSLYGTLAVLPTALTPAQREVAESAAYIGLVVTLAWLATAVVRAARDAVRSRLDLSKADNLSERRLLTQVGLLQRVIVVGIVVIAVAAVLLHFETFRRIGTGLLASAGIAGIVLGFAAQRVLGNLLAGIQIAITQPIRVEDVVVVEGEWGQVEEITLTYVIVRLWDLRRLVLPISYFIEQPFQNWTRQSAQVIGSVYVRTDYTVSTEAVREEIGRIAAASEYHDGDVFRLHVTDLGEQAVELRAILTAPNAGAAWELRAEVRERLLAWFQDRHPEALPRTRITFPDGQGAGRAPAVWTVRADGA